MHVLAQWNLPNLKLKLNLMAHASRATIKTSIVADHVTTVLNFSACHVTPLD